jgi:hypothetical protein
VNTSGRPTCGCRRSRSPPDSHTLHV